MKKEMKELVELLVKNEDFASCEDFKEELAEDKQAVIDDLKWRADGGVMKNEILPAGYAEVCKQILEYIK